MVEMLTAKDMQELLQVDRSTIYRMAEAGRLPAIKVGRQWRFPSDQVENWFQSQAPAAASPPKAPAPTGNQESLAALLPIECTQIIIDSFADALEVMLVVTDMAGKPITEISHPCGLFTTISQVPDALQKCIAGWHQLGSSLSLEPKFMPSHLGLLCARGLIRIGPELKGMVVVGCIAPDTWPPDRSQVEAMAQEFNLPPADVEAQLSQVFYRDKAERARILTFVQRIADIVAHIGNERYLLMGKLESIAKLAS